VTELVAMITAYNNLRSSQNVVAAWMMVKVMISVNDWHLWRWSILLSYLITAEGLFDDNASQSFTSEYQKLQHVNIILYG
jgi:hypothetical protein